MADYDVIVVGSGAGGLAAALKVVQGDRSVLLLEAAPAFGGCIGPMHKAGYSFDMGLHYLGEFGEGQRSWKALDEIGLAGRVEFVELNPEAIDRYVFPDFELRLCKGKERFKEQLIQLFPNEERGIHKYFKIYEPVTRAVESFVHLDARPLQLLGWMLRNPVMLKYARVPYQTLLDEVTSDIRLQTALAACWFDYMLPPETASAAYAIETWYHYLSGAYYPRGGSGALRNAFVDALLERGAELRSSSRVTSIDRQNGELVVTSADGQQWTSNVVVSDVNPVLTLGQLVNPELVPSRVAEKVARLRPSRSSFGLFVGTDLDLPSLGMTTGNLVHYGCYDINKIFGETMASESPKISNSVFVLSPSVRDPGLAPDGQHSLEILVGASYEAFERWAHLPPEERGEEYDAFVKALGDELIATVERYIPGLSQHLQFVEYVTPLTFERGINLVRGGIYGPEMTSDQMGPGRFPKGTCGVEGLFLAGAGIKGGNVRLALTTGIHAGRRALAFLKAG
jgi:phytoene dehydrogenase-like protein